ncbi:MAG: hypothetical protein AB9M60_20065 [Leptothrix sp. (in: b-proteobacteria)]
MKASQAALDTPADLGALALLAPQLAQTFVSMASDIALVLDAAGTVVHGSASRVLEPLARGWVGQAWADTVGRESRHKIEQMLDDIHRLGVTRRREVNHPRPGQADLPVAYAGIRLGQDGPVLAVGRDLQAAAALQQRFLAAQHELGQAVWQPAAQPSGTARHVRMAPAATDAPLAPLGSSARRVTPLRPEPEVPPARPVQVGALTTAISSLASQVGLVSLPELVREASDLAERHLIELALQRATGLLPKAAGLLGIRADELIERMRAHAMPVISAMPAARSVGAEAQQDPPGQGDRAGQADAAP